MNRRTFLTRCAGCAAGLSLLTSPRIATNLFASNEEKSKEQILKELEEKAGKNLPKLRSCAMASFASLNEQFELNADEKTLRALMPFTGGLGLHGETCGAVSGSLLAIGFFFDPMTSIGHGGKFFERFTEEFTSTRCKDILKHQYGRSYDFHNPEEQKLFMEASAKTNKCAEVVKKAVSIAGEIILEKKMGT
jgi:C_GCAxxG_C_C family probable redox protein